MGSTYLVDSSVLLAQLNESEDAEQARQLLLRAHAAGTLFINGVVAAEVSPAFKSAAEFRRFLNDFGLHFFDFQLDTAIEAGRLWKKYLVAGGKRKDRIIADFIIAASAMECSGLVTLDGRFPRLTGLSVFG